MSLINDALRRADQAKKNPGSEPSSGAPMQPVHPPATSDASPIGPILFILIAIVIVGAGWFFLKGWRTHSQPGVTTTAPVNSSQAEGTIPAAEKINQPVKTVESIQSSPESNLAIAAATESTNTSATNSAESNATVVAVPTPPPLKLQGIIYRIKNATAMINGKSLMVGENISGARVTKIGKEEVTLERDGQTLVLKLP